MGHRCVRLTRMPTLAVGLSLMTLVGAGCDSSSSRSSVGRVAARGAPSPNARFISSADEICRRFALALSHSRPRSLRGSDLAKNALDHERIERAAVAQLTRLTVPASLSSDWRRIIEYKKLLAAELHTVSRAWKTDDKLVLNVLGNSKRKNHLALLKLATHDGFKSCGETGLPATAKREVA